MTARDGELSLCALRLWRVLTPSVAQRVDSAIRYSIGFDSIYPLDSSTRLFNNWVLVTTELKNDCACAKFEGFGAIVMESSAKFVSLKT